MPGTSFVPLSLLKALTMPGVRGARDEPGGSWKGILNPSSSQKQLHVPLISASNNEAIGQGSLGPLVSLRLWGAMNTGGKIPSGDISVPTELPILVEVPTLSLGHRLMLLAPARTVLWQALPT